MNISFYGLNEQQNAAVNELLPQLGMKASQNGISVYTELGDKLSVKNSNGAYKITYSRQCELFRALSYLARDEQVEESASFSMLCYMADMSRNAVFNIPSAKRMIRYLALMGYDSLMLYTEDTYEVEQYRYFGHMRGRFSKAELKEIVAYADLFGIEVIPCIQTLAHLDTALNWPQLSEIRDINGVMTVGEDKTYHFIEECLKVCRECFHSQKINIGMDEAHFLGLGNYLKKNGYHPASEIMLEHLDRVVRLCHEYGYEPMMWSDMFFRMAFGRYYVSEGEIAEDIINRVPKGLSLVHWDYFTLDRRMFEHMADCHLKFHNRIVFAGGAWKWSGFAPHNRFSMQATELQLDVYKSKGVSDIIVTSWGDNGGEASQFSVLPSMLYYAEYSYSIGKPDAVRLENRSQACFGLGFEALLTLDAPNELPKIAQGNTFNPSRYLLYNDPLEGLFDLHFDSETAAETFSENAKRLEQFAENQDFGYIFITLAALCKFLAIKCDLSVRLRDAYKNGERDVMYDIASKDITECIERLNAFVKALRKQWYYENKTFGLGVCEIRLGGLKERLSSTAERIHGYLSGEYEKIEELEQPVLSFDGRVGDELEKQPYIQNQNWSSTVTSCVI